MFSVPIQISCSLSAPKLFTLQGCGRMEKARGLVDCIFGYHNVYDKY